MGIVYKAEDVTDGSIVALKVLRADWAANPEHLRRFHKEARLLAEVNNPHVTNLLGVNEGHGFKKKENRDYYSAATMWFLEQELKPRGAPPG